jgi:hypothetical protein
MQVDSISRMPWFNFEFMERKKKSDGPAHREVRLDAPEKSRIEKLVGNRKNEATIQLSDKSRRSLPPTDRTALESTTADASEFDFR